MLRNCHAPSLTNLRCKLVPMLPPLPRPLLLLLQSQGPKQTMEDCNCLAALHPQHGVLSSLPSQGVCISQQHVAVAAVFDGHAGCQTAATAAEHLPHLLHQGLSGRQGSSAACEGAVRWGEANAVQQMGSHGAVLAQQMRLCGASVVSTAGAWRGNAQLLHLHWLCGRGICHTDLLGRL